MKWKKEWQTSKAPEWKMSDPPEQVWECDLCGNMFYSVRESIAHEAIQWYLFWQEAEATYHTLLWPNNYNKINARIEIEKTRDKAEETFKGLVEQIERGDNG